MKKIISFLFVLFGSIVLAGYVQADTDIVTLPATTHTYVGTNVGAGPISIDGDFDTPQAGNYGGGGYYETSSTHIFNKDYRISRLSFRWGLDAYSYADNSPGIDTYAKVQYLDGSEWKDFTGPYTSFSDCRNDDDGDVQTHQDSGRQNIDLNLNCSGVRIWISTNTGGHGNETRWSSARIYELQAWGSVDIGLRLYDGTEAVKIACEPAGVLTSPLRVHKDGTTYAIVLVEPSDSRASKLRVKTERGIKALAKI
ncbi:MAG: hypothetical protein PHR44_05745 [Candidatus Omnitrophica bacterium]|nr:hypothetical protein [Candidatus Omnitrophota bacterium]